MTTPAPPPCIPACSGGGGSPTTVTAGPGTVVTGDPTAGYTVSAPPSADPDNLLRPGSDGLLSVTCTDLTACGFGDTVVTPGAGVTITGNGDPATPYVVNALSADAGQILVEGADGGILLNCATVAACVPGGGGSTVVTPGAGVYMSGTGDPATPYVVNALSADADNILIEGADGGVKLDCGTVTGGSTWPHACPVDTAGQRAYCAPDGSLRLPPEKFYDAAAVEWQVVPSAGQPIADLAPPDATYRQIGPTTSLTFVNPSDCLPMRITVECILLHVALTSGSGPQVDVALESRVALSGDVTDAYNAHQIWRADSPQDITSSFTFDSMGVTTRRVYTLPPGGSVTVDGSQWLNVRNDQVDAASPNPNRLSNWVGQIHVWGGNL